MLKFVPMQFDQKDLQRLKERPDLSQDVRGLIARAATLDYELKKARRTIRELQARLDDIAALGE